MKDPTFDSSGYPTDETISLITSFDLTKEDVGELIEFIKEAWQDYGKIFETDGVSILGKKVKMIEFITGGWSGNEDIISALQSNLYFFHFIGYAPNVVVIFSSRFHFLHLFLLMPHSLKTLLFSLEAVETTCKFRERDKQDLRVIADVLTKKRF